MLKLSKIAKITSGVAIASSLLVSSVFAQQSSDSKAVGLEVTSPIYEYTISPGKVQQDIIKIKNVGGSEQTYYPEVLDFKSDNKSGTPIFLNKGEDSGTYSLAKWVSVSNEGITLAPNQSTALNFNITVPADAEPGGHYAGILFSTQPPDPSGTNQIGLASKVGSIVLVRVAGDAKESANITAFDSDKDSYDTAKVVKFSTTIENTGNVHVQPKGVITIKNIFGGQVAVVDVNNLSANVLPGSSRIFNSTWNDPGFKLGYYTATVTLAYGSPAQTITAQTSFWIIPWMTLLLILIAIIVTLVVLYFVLKRYNSWIISRASKKPSENQ